MSIDQTNVVDFIGVDIRTGELILTVTDHLEWTGSDNEHILLLQDKLDSYLRFVESGEYLQTYPDAKERLVVINVVHKYPLSEEAVSFFSKVVPIVADAGIEFRYRLSDAH